MGDDEFYDPDTEVKYTPRPKRRSTRIEVAFSPEQMAESITRLREQITALNATLDERPFHMDWGLEEL